MKIYSEIIESLREKSPLKQQFALAALGAAVAAVPIAANTLIPGLGVFAAFSVATLAGLAAGKVVCDVSANPNKKGLSPLHLYKEKKYWKNVAAIAAGILTVGVLTSGISSDKEDITPAIWPDKVAMLEEGSAQAQQPENIIAAKTPGGPSPS